MIKKIAITSQEISPLIAKRWSPRSFNFDKAVSKAQLISIAEAGRWSASASNEQPWNVIFVNKDIDKESYDKVFNSLAGGNQLWCKNSPCFGVLIARTVNEVKENPNAWAGFDCGSALTSMMLQATELGLSTHPMAGFDESKVIESFDIPENHKVYAIFALGYQDDENKLDEPFYTREITERTRKNINDNFYFGAWGKGIGE